MSGFLFEVPSEMRDFAELGVEQARKAFESFVAATQRAAGVADGTAIASQGGMKSVGAHVIACTEQNVNAAFDLAEKLIKVRDPQAAFALQSEYLRTQLETLQAQAKDFGVVLQKTLIPA